MLDNALLVHIRDAERTYRAEGCCILACLLITMYLVYRMFGNFELAVFEFLHLLMHSIQQLFEAGMSRADNSLRTGYTYGHIPNISCCHMRCPALRIPPGRQEQHIGLA